jgi:hypothetical protein
MATTAAVAAVIILNRIPLWQYGFRHETLIVPLLACYALAVFAGFRRLLAVVQDQAAAGKWKGRIAGVLTVTVATVILFAAAGVLYVEWSAYESASALDRSAFAQAKSAMEAVAQRRAANLTPLTRREIEALIGCQGEEASPEKTAGLVRVTYRWKGGSRSYVLHTDYVRHPSGPVNPAPWRTDYDPGSDVLNWVNDVVE